jgi:hypothetical protein
MRGHHDGSGCKPVDFTVGDRVRLTSTGRVARVFTIDASDADLDLFHLAGHHEATWHSRDELAPA